jgi:hypothetical protein
LAPQVGEVPDMFQLHSLNMERISLIFQLLEEMDKENKKRFEHQRRRRVGFKRADEQK